MAPSDVTHKPLDDQASADADANAGSSTENGASDRYRPLPTGTHGLDPELVKHDQRERLRGAIIELIAEKGYPAVRIVDSPTRSRLATHFLQPLHRQGRAFPERLR